MKKIWKQLRADELRVESPAAGRISRTLNSQLKILSIIFLVILHFSFFILPLCAQERPTDYQVKAVFLEKFGKFVEWPAKAFAETNAPLVIGVFGDGGSAQAAFQGALETVASKDSINGRSIRVVQIKAPPDLKSCQIVFIPASEKSREREILDAIKGLPILTVGETDDFYEAGGMIEFVIEDTQVHFRIDNPAARDAGLKISSKLLTLARP